MTLPPPSFLPALAAFFLLSGCVSSGPFPSLAPREEERAAGAGQPSAGAPSVPDDAALRARIGALAALAAGGERDFGEALGTASAAVRAAGSRGSESWIAAQEKLSRLESARARTTVALADLDRLALARAALPTSPDDHAALLAALAEANRLAAGQQARIDGLRATISGR